MDALEIALIGPEAAAYQRRFGNQQMMEGTSGAPVQHWTQALNRVAQGAVGGMREAGVRENEQRASEMRKQALMNALNGGDMQGSAMEMLGNPATEDMGMQLAQNVFSQRQAAEAAQARAQEQELAHQRQKDLIDYRASVASQGGGGAADYGKAGQIVQGGDGRYYTVQFASDGTRKILPLTFQQAQVQSMLEGGQPIEPQEPVPLQPARGVTEVDTGTEVELRDRMTGEVVQRVPKQLAEAERQTIVGRNQGEVEANAPKARSQMAALESQHQIIDREIDRALPMINSLTTGFAGTALAQIPGTAANDVRQLILTVKANIGFDKLQQMRELSPTGGALGQVAVQELQALQAVLGSLEQSQTPEQLRQNLTNLKTALADMRAIRRQAMEQTYGGVAQAAPSAQQSEAPALPPGFSIRRLD